MSVLERDPLQPLSTNTLASSSSPSHSSPASSSTPRNVKLAPIFTRTYSRPRPSPSTSTHQNGPASSPCPVRDEDERSRKRVRLDLYPGTGMDADENADEDLPRGRLNSIQSYFVSTPLRAEAYSPEVSAKGALKSAIQDIERREEGVWRRRRGRGIRQRATMSFCTEGKPVSASRRNSS